MLVLWGNTQSNLLASSLALLASEVSLLARFGSSVAAIPRPRVQDSLIISTTPILKTPSRNSEWQWRISMVSIDLLDYSHPDLISSS